MKKTIIILCLLSLSLGMVSAQKKQSLASPNGKLNIIVTLDNQVKYKVSYDGDIILNESPIGMLFADGTKWGVDAKLTKSSQKTINETIESPVYKRAKVSDHYNELKLDFKGKYSIIFRAYNDGLAYRFVNNQESSLTIKNEQVAYHLPADTKAFVAYVRTETAGLSIENQFFNSFENIYDRINITGWDKNRIAFSPLVLEAANGKKVAILEADLLDYPGMFLYNGDGSTTLTGMFAPYPKEIENGGHNGLQAVVKSRENYMAKTNGKQTFPWRAMVVAENDKALADNDMVFKLATPAPTMDFSWVKPGKVAWDWWNNWNLYGVDFETGINTETYKYYIDFAAAHNIEYVILDEGWAVNLKADLMQVVPEIDLVELVAYGRNKNVDLILWAGYHAFERDMEHVCAHYSKMGIKGFKVDFMDRDDQPMVNFHTRAAQIGAKYKLLINFHGTYKPTGLQRTYPNVINFEGVHGLEQMKWSEIDIDQVIYDVTLPFTRMLAGPFDYTQGAMRNATKENYKAVYTEAMSQGTRCRQLAQYVIFESPLTMLCDNPSNYMREKECTAFISSVPTVWDNTISLDGKIGEYVSIARQKGSDWYVGALTNWDARTLELDLSFLGEGKFKAEIFKDGVNAKKVAKDYKKEIIDIPSSKKLSIKMAPGGGHVMRIYRKDK